jgi:type II secretory pathway pseudopilin PulG
MQRRELTVSMLALILLGATLIAAVAPSYIDARIRNRLARVKSDMAHLAAALEAYQTDNANYPNDMEFGWPWYPTYNLTTPISYVSSEIFRDPFRREHQESYLYFKLYRYINFPANNPSAPWKGLPNDTWRPTPSQTAYSRGLAKYGLWRLSSSGPDGLATYSGFSESDPGPGFDWFTNCMVYDPTNGAASIGDILRCQKTGEVTLMGGPEF